MTGAAGTPSGRPFFSSGRSSKISKATHRPGRQKSGDCKRQVDEILPTPPQSQGLVVASEETRGAKRIASELCNTGNKYKQCAGRYSLIRNLL